MKSYLIENDQIFVIKNLLTHFFLSNPVSKNLLDTSGNGITARIQSQFNDDLVFYHSLKILGVLIKTTATTYGKLIVESCISFSSADDQVKYGLIRDIV